VVKNVLKIFSFSVTSVTILLLVIFQIGVIFGIFRLCRSSFKVDQYFFGSIFGSFKVLFKVWLG